MKKPFFRRAMEARGEIPDVYVYDEMPKSVRIQIVRILERFVDAYAEQVAQVRLYDLVHEKLCDELGRFKLHDVSFHQDYSPYTAVYRFMVEEEDPGLVLTAVEEFVFVLRIFAGESWLGPRGKEKLQDSIDDINYRMSEARIGYSIENGMIIRKDSDFLHSEAVRPALKLISGAGLEAVNQEFREAHRHYRNRDLSDCLVDCCNALESTAKVICKQKEWSHSDKATLGPLLDTLKDNGLLTGYLATSFKSIGTIRNQNGGHGAGETPRQVPESLVALQMHLTATAIKYVVSAANESTGQPDTTESGTN